MMPNSKILPHSDYCNFALTSHLGVDVPEGLCWISVALKTKPQTNTPHALKYRTCQVGNERREWRNGEMLLFDTSLIHQAANEADVTISLKP